jgi:hypothetical protein
MPAEAAPLASGPAIVHTVGGGLGASLIERAGGGQNEGVGSERFPTPCVTFVHFDEVCWSCPQVIHKGECTGIVPFEMSLENGLQFTLRAYYNFSIRSV